MRNLRLLQALLIFLASCAAPLRPGLLPSTLAPMSQYNLKVAFTSDVPEEYYVLSGPAETYRGFRVNDALRAALDEYSRRKSAPGSERSASVHVTLLSVKTAYDQLRAEAAAPEILRASALWLPVGEGDMGPRLPKQMTKQVSVTVAVRIEVDGKVLRNETYTAEATEVIDRDSYGPSAYVYDPWAYDYGSVLEKALRRCLETLDRVVGEALASAAKG